MQTLNLDDHPCNVEAFWRGLPVDSVIGQRFAPLREAFVRWADEFQRNDAIALVDFIDELQFADMQNLQFLSLVPRTLCWAAKVAGMQIGSLRVAVEMQGPEDGRWFESKLYGLPSPKSLQIRRAAEGPVHSSHIGTLPSNVSLVSRTKPRSRSIPIASYFDTEHADLFWVQPALVIAAARQAPDLLARALSRAVFIVHSNHPAGDSEAVVLFFQILGLELYNLDFESVEDADNPLLAVPIRTISGEDVQAALQGLTNSEAFLAFPLGALRGAHELAFESPPDMLRRVFSDGSILSEEGVYTNAEGERVSLARDTWNMRKPADRFEAVRMIVARLTERSQGVPEKSLKIRPFDLESEHARRAAQGPSAAMLKQRSAGSVVDEDGRTPLHFLAEFDDIGSLSRAWIAAGVDVNRKDADGRTALEVALWRNARWACACLVEHGANIAEQSCCGRILGDWSERIVQKYRADFLAWHSVLKRRASTAGALHSHLDLLAGKDGVVPVSVPAPLERREGIRARTTPVFAWAAELPLSQRVAAMDAVKRWLKQRGGLSVASLEGADVAAEGSAFQSSSDLESGLWAARFTKAVDEGQAYRTEFVMFPRGAVLCVGVRLVYQSKAGVTPDPTPSIPAIVAQLAALNARDAGLRLGIAIPARSADEGGTIAQLLASTTRNQAVLLVASDARGSVEMAVPRRIFGACHVVFADHEALRAIKAKLPPSARVPEEGEWRLYPPQYGATLQRGQDTSVLVQNVLSYSEALHYRRLTTYLCRFSAEDLEAFDVPTYIELRKVMARRASERAASDRIAARHAAQVVQEANAPPTASEPQASLPGSEDSAHVAGIASSVAEETVAPEELAPNLSDVRAQDVEPAVRDILDRAQGAAQEELQLRIWELEDELARAQKEIQELRDELSLVEEDLEEKVDALKEARETNAGLRFRLAQRAAVTAERADAEGYGYPDSFDDLDDWVLARFPEKLVLSSKAIRAARASQLDAEVIRQAYGALELLATDYLDARAGVAGANDRCRATAEALRIEISQVGVAVSHGRYRESYKTQIDGKTYQLDLHVSGSSSWDPSRCLRIYFHFDAELGRIVVGHLPTHLDNTLS